MERVQKRFSWMTERNLLILILLFMTVFAARIATQLSQAMVVALLFPWAIGKAYQLKRDGDIPRSAPVLCSVAAMIVYILSTIVMGNLTMGFVHLLWSMAICAFFLMVPPRKLTLRGQHNELLSIGCMFVCIYLPFALVAMYSVFTGRVIRFPSITNPIGIQEINDVDCQLRIFSNPNTTCRYACFNIVFSIYAFIRMRRMWAKGFFAFNAVLNFFVLAHTQSRTGYIALAAAFAALAFRFFWLRAKKFRIAAALIAAAVVFFAVVKGLELLFLADVRLAKSLIASVEQFAETVPRSEVRGHFNMLSSGRGEVWNTVIAYLREHPSYLITGMNSPDAFTTIARGHEQLELLGSCHNTYLGCILLSGVPFLLCILAFLCTLVRPCVSMLLEPADEENRGMFIVPVFIGMMLAMSFPEEMLFVNTGFVNYLFYFLCGHLLHYARLRSSLPSGKAESK